jgi:hypothetical protein
MLHCSQKKRDGDYCDGVPVVRYTWPGQDEQFACLEHAQTMKNIATGMGLHVQLLPIPGEYWLTHGLTAPGES